MINKKEVIYKNYQPKEKSPEDMLSVKEVAEIIAVSVQTIRNLVNKKLLQSVTIGAKIGKQKTKKGTVRIKRCWVDQYINSLNEKKENKT